MAVYADTGSVGSTGADTLARLCVALPREHGFEPPTIDRELPAELRGTLYRNGPGLFGQRGFLAVYDAARLADSTRARAWLEHPIAFHGTFVPTSR